MPKTADAGAYWQDGAAPYLHPGLNTREALLYSYIEERAGGLSVASYGAAFDGVTDDTAAWNLAVADAQTSGKWLVMPAGTSVVQPLTVSADLNVAGQGWASILQLKAGSNGYVFNFSPPGGGIKANFRDFAIDGNAGNQTSGGCIYAAGAIQSRFYGLHLYAAYDVALWLYQISPGVIGHHNRVLACLFDQMNSVVSATQQGVRIQSNDENYIAFCDFENWGGAAGTPGAEPYAIKDWAGLSAIVSNVFVGGQEAIRVQDASSTRIVANIFDGQGRAGVHASGSKNVISANTFSNASSSSTGAYAQCEIDNSTSATITSNTFNVTTSGIVRNCIRELSSSSHKTIVSDNVIDLTGGTLFGGNKAVELLSSLGDSKAVNNPGWNPVGPLTAPGVPLTTVALTNTQATDCSVFIAGGTVTAVAIGGTATGLTSGMFSVPAGQTITLTYSVAPTWTWFGD